MTTSPTVQEMQKMLRLFRRGGALRMVLEKDVTESLDVLYRYAMQLKNAKEHTGAARILRLLTVYDAWSFEYWYSLGQCCQAQKDWSDAVYAYGRAAQIRLDAPEAPWAAAECYLACGNDEYARKSLNAVLLICGNREEYQALRLQVNTVLVQIANRRGV